MVWRMPPQRILCTNPIEPSQFFELQMARRYRYLLFIRTVFIILMGVLSMHSWVAFGVGWVYFSRLQKRRLLTVSKKIQHIERFPFSAQTVVVFSWVRTDKDLSGVVKRLLMYVEPVLVYCCFGLSGAVFERYGYVIEAGCICNER